MTEKKRYSGFTLVEVLLATGVGVLLVLMAVGIFRSVVNNRERLTSYSEVSSLSRYALNKIRDDLANLYTSSPPWYRLEGESMGTADARSDRIRFNAVGEELNIEGKISDIYEIEYGLAYDEQKGAKVLTRRTGAVADANTGNKGGYLMSLAAGVSGLSFEYYSDGLWKNIWQNRDKAPERVRVTLMMATNDNPAAALRFSREITLRQVCSEGAHAAEFQDSVREPVAVPGAVDVE